MLRVSVIVLALCLVATMLAPVALADQFDKKTVLTVNEPIQVPGKVLMPGKYVVKLFDSLSNRNIVQIFNEDETEVLATIIAIPNYRLHPTGETHFSYWEAPVNKPVPLKSWFYPGDNFGQEFAYPKETAVEIARESKELVPAISTEKAAELPSAEVGLVDQSGKESILEQAPQSWTTEPAVEPPPRVDAAPEPVQAAEPAPVEKPETLPETATNLPLMGLLGLGSIGAGVMLRFFAKRTA